MIWKTVSKAERPRHIYKDPLMQEVRDKIETLEVLREAIGDRKYCGNLYLEAERDISRRTKTDDMFLQLRVDLIHPGFRCFDNLPFSAFGITVDCKADTYSAEVQIYDERPKTYRDDLEESVFDEEDVKSFMENHDEFDYDAEYDPKNKEWEEALDFYTFVLYEIDD